MSREPTDHIYAPRKDRDEQHRRTIQRSINRGNVVRLHRHDHGKQCNGMCVTYEPAEETTDGAS